MWDTSTMKNPVVARLLTIAVLLIAPLTALSSQPANATTVQWTWPVDPPHTVIRAFQRPPAKWKAGHRGIDIAAQAGDPVYAAGAGVVQFVGWVARKPVVTIAHGSLRTTYEPVMASVHRGQHIAAGQQIGLAAPGWSHCSPLGVVVCIHWGARRAGTYLDPLDLLRRRVRLLPLGGT